MIQRSLLVLATAGAVVAADPAAPAAEAPAARLETAKAKTSYLIGSNIGRNIKRDQIDIDFEALLQGVRDAADGRESRLSPEESQAVMAQFQKEIEEKRASAGAELAAKNSKAGDEHLATNKKKASVTTTASGLQYEVLKKGSGPKPKPTDTVKVHYHGTLLDGTIFDSSVQRGEPATFGVTQVIPGWVEALQLMPVGSKWKLTIPSKLAYGEEGQGNVIAPNATLVFEVELLGIEKAKQ